MLSLLTPPSLVALSFAEMAAQLRLGDETTEQVYINTLIAAATRAVEQYTDRALLTQSWRLTLDAWPKQARSHVYSESGAIPAGSHARRVFLQKKPVQSIVEVRVNIGGSWQSVAPTLYRLDQDGLIVDSSVPQPDVFGGIQIDFVAGHTSAAAIPADMLHALKLLVATWFEGRTAGDGAASVPAAVAALLYPYRTQKI